MRNILRGAFALGVVAVAVTATVAFFSDTETSSNNVFTAGAIDLLIDSEAHYAGLVCVDTGNGYIWVDEETGETNPEESDTTRPDLLGQSCSGSWESTDLDNVVGSTAFFNYNDIKPGDEGENTISLTVEDNDAWACMRIDNMTNDENGQNEPELEVDNTPDVGELSDNLHFTAWLDQGNDPGWQGQEDDPAEGDNIWQGEDVEPLLFSNESGPASDVLGGRTYALAAASGAYYDVPLQGAVTHYIGLQWCAGEMTIVGNTIECDGSTMGNDTQTDSLTADMMFYVEQSRNNPDFSCDDVEWPTQDEPVEPIQASGPFDGWNGDGDLIWQAEGRFGNNGASGDWEVGVGTNTQNPATFNNAQSTWTSGEAVAFEVDYNAGTGTATFTVDGNTASYVVGPITSDADLNIIAGKVSAGAGDSVELGSLMLNGVPLSPDALVDTDNANASYLVVSSEDLSGGFTLTGMVEFNFTPGDTSGSRPAFQVQVRD